MTASVVSCWFEKENVLPYFISHSWTFFLLLKNKQQKQLNFFFSTFFMREKNPQANLVSTYLPK